MNCRAITNIVLYLHEPSCTIYYLVVPMYIHAIYASLLWKSTSGISFPPTSRNIIFWKFLLLIIYIDYCGSTVSLNGCKEYTTVGTPFQELKIEGYNALIQNSYTLLNEWMARTQKIDVNELLPVLAGS